MRVIFLFLLCTVVERGEVSMGCNVSIMNGLTYTTDTLLYPYHLSLHLNQFSQHEDGGTIILQNAATLYYYMVPKYNKKRPVFE